LVGSARTHSLPLSFLSCVWNDCQGTVGKLHVHLLFLGVIFGNILEGVVMNSIRDIDRRNGKSGGRVLFTGLGI